MMDVQHHAFQLALAARERAYAVYSNFKVGCAIKFKGVDEIFYGCNVENSSYGGTICAERSAVAHAVSKVGKHEIELVVVVTQKEEVGPPCGICRQTLSEFSSPETLICLANLNGIQKKLKFKEIMPYPFLPSDL
jgi:cytidine deaminase